MPSEPKKPTRNGMPCCPQCGVYYVVPHGHEPGCPLAGRDQTEINELVVTGWLR